MTLNNAKKPRHIANIIGTSAKLREIRTHASLIHQTNQMLLSYLPKPLSENCSLANIKNNCAIFHTHSPGWASKIRFNSATIRHILHQQLGMKTIQSIRVKVSLTSAIIDSRPPAKPRHLSRSTASLLSKYADSIPHPPIQAALKRLASHTIKQET